MEQRLLSDNVTGTWWHVSDLFWSEAGCVGDLATIRAQQQNRSRKETHVSGVVTATTAGNLTVWRVDCRDVLIQNPRAISWRKQVHIPEIFEKTIPRSIYSCYSKNKTPFYLFESFWPYHAPCHFFHSKKCVSKQAASYESTEEYFAKINSFRKNSWKPVGCGTVKQLNMFKWSLKHPKLCKVVLFANCKPLCLRNQWLKKTSMITKSNSQREH